MIPNVEIQIAAIAISTGRVLLSDDAHFSNVQGLTRDNWVR